MSKQIEALKLALEALENASDIMDSWAQKRQDDAITAIKEALAQPEQEPVVNCNGMPAIEGPLSASQNGVYPWFMKWNKCADFWAHYMCINEQAQEDRAYEAKRWIERMRQAAELKANTQKQWVGLTDEDVGQCFEVADGTIGSLIRAIEAKLKERNA